MKHTEETVVRALNLEWENIGRKDIANGVQFRLLEGASPDSQRQGAGQHREPPQRIDSTILLRAADAGSAVL